MADVDGEYLVYVGDDPYVVNVVDGSGDVIVDALTVGSYDVNVTVVDGNYSAVNTTSFDVSAREIDVSIFIDDITYGESALVIVLSEVDGEYIVEIYNQNYTVTVADGKGNTTIPDLFVNEDILASVSIADGNYSAYNTTTFNIVPKEIPVIISVGNITYGEDAVVIVQSDVDGDYIVTIRDVNYTVSVNGGDGVRFISGLGAGDEILASVSATDGNYSAYNTTTFNIAPKGVSVVISVGNITYGEDAVVIVEAEIDGEYLVHVENEQMLVTVIDGAGNASVSNLIAGSYVANVTVINSNYTAVNSTSFDVAVKQINISVFADDITYEESALITVVADVDGVYLVYVDEDPYLVTVLGSMGGVAVDGLTVGSYDVYVTVVDGNYSGFDSTSFDVAAKEINVSVFVDDITYGESALISVVADVDGVYLVYVDEDPYLVTVLGSMGGVAVDGLTVGSYDVYVTVVDGNYSGFDSTSFDVAAKQANISVIVDDITYGENATVTVILPEDATGTVTIGNETVDVVNGTASAVLSNLPVGNNTIPITYSGDDQYKSIETDVSVSVKEGSDIISAPDVIKYFHGSERFIVTVTDYQGNPIANKSVVIVINSQSYTRTTDANGTASIGLNLGSDVYLVTTTVDNTTIDSVVTILSTIKSTDLVKVFRNATQYYATFLDSNGNYLADGTTVRFNINGVFYERKVSGNKGLAKLNINLPAGEYIITAINLETGEKASNNITVIPRIVENNDLTKYYRNASQYTVKLIGDDGNPVGAGENVTFNINGVFYTRTTDASGMALLNVNLIPGDYVITAEYKGCKVSNNIKVLPTLTAEDMTKKYGQAGAFEATLVNGQGKPYANQKISFNINGVFYTITTNDNGIAKLNINLQPGEYIITSTYGEAAISNKVTVTA